MSYSSIGLKKLLAAQVLLFSYSPQQAGYFHCGLPLVIRFWVTLKQNPSPLRGARSFLRSVADSNRRKRFCRPLPSHSVNRPYYIKRTLNSQLFQWRISRLGCSPALRDRELLHSFHSVRTAVNSFVPSPRDYLATRLTDHRFRSAKIIIFVLFIAFGINHILIFDKLSIFHLLINKQT